MRFATRDCCVPPPLTVSHPDFPKSFLKASLRQSNKVLENSPSRMQKNRIRNRSSIAYGGSASWTKRPSFIQASTKGPLARPRNGRAMKPFARRRLNRSLSTAGSGWRDPSSNSQPSATRSFRDISPDSAAPRTPKAATTQTPRSERALGYLNPSGKETRLWQRNHGCTQRREVCPEGLYAQDLPHDSGAA
jgi:hypothetical protein